MQTGIVQTLPLPFAQTLRSFWIFPKSSTFAHGMWRDLPACNHTKNAKIFHIVFLVSLHVFRIRWSFLFSPAALKCDV